MNSPGSRIARCFGILFAAAATAVLAQSNPSATDHGSASTSDKNAMSSKTKGSSDQAFVQEAGVGGLAEVEMGRLAVQKAKDDRVRQFGQKMIDDHSKANDQLKQAASQEGLSVPSAVDEKHKATMARLEKLSGAQFDSAYAKEMVKDHKEDVKLFEKESTAGSSAVQKFAAETLPTLKNHLQMAEALGSGGSSTGSAGSDH
jgi:putative membrane protein